MRIISLVPSWTETLIAADANLVGCTRFCIHPQEVTQSLPKVGGTKNIDWNKVMALKPDLLIFDQEENPLEFAKQATLRKIPWIATHVTSFETMLQEMRRLGQELKLSKLTELTLAGQNLNFSHCLGKNIPGLIETVGTPNPQGKLAYMIWRDPWMAVNQGTFIHDLCLKIGYPLAPIHSVEKYPKVSDDFIKTHNLFFASEPYPFHKNKMQLDGLNGWIINGENLSWFGVRSLNFLTDFFS